MLARKVSNLNRSSNSVCKFSIDSCIWKIRYPRSSSLMLKSIPLVIAPLQQSLICFGFPNPYHPGQPNPGGDELWCRLFQNRSAASIGGGPVRSFQTKPGQGLPEVIAVPDGRCRKIFRPDHHFRGHECQRHRPIPGETRVFLGYQNGQEDYQPYCLGSYLHSEF